nr:HEPN domain-containing protein [Candidatus Njordarchaeota archaeon]
MNSRRMAESFLDEAELRLKTAQKALSDEHFSYAIRQSQECVELSMKGALRFVAVEPPKWHDVGIILRKESKRFPESFKNEIDRLSLISRELAGERERSMYGDDELKLVPEELYTKLDAQEAVDNARFVYELCRKLLKV